jgi:acyl carrier protein
MSDADLTATLAPTQQRLCALWAETLGLDAVGAADDFFELGGDSLLALHLVSRIEADFGARVPAGGIFTHRTVAMLAAAIDRLEGRERKTPAPAPDISLPLLPFQMHSVSRSLTSDPRGQLQTYLFELAPEMSPATLIQAIAVWTQQEVFRLRLRREGRSWRQTWRPATRYDALPIEEWTLDEAAPDSDAGEVNAGEGDAGHAKVGHPDAGYANAGYANAGYADWIVAALAERCWTLADLHDRVADAPCELALVRVQGRPRYLVWMIDQMLLVDPRFVRDQIEHLRATCIALGHARPAPPSPESLLRRWAERMARRQHDTPVPAPAAIRIWREQWSHVKRGGGAAGSRRRDVSVPGVRFAAAALPAIETDLLIRTHARRGHSFDEVCLGGMLWALRSCGRRTSSLVAMIDRGRMTGRGGDRAAGREPATVYPALFEWPAAVRPVAFLDEICAQSRRYARTREQYGLFRHRDDASGSLLAQVEDWSQTTVFDCPGVLEPRLKETSANETSANAASANATAPIRLSSLTLALDRAYQCHVDRHAARRDAVGLIAGAGERFTFMLIGGELHAALAFDPARWDEAAARQLLAYAMQALLRMTTDAA